MKKTLFTALRAMCVGVMTLAAVSCYDDSYLNSEIDGLKGEVADLAARMDALEASINSDVSNVEEIEAAVSALEKSFNEAIAANKAEVEKSFEDKIAALKKDLEAAIAAGDKANADALAKEKEAFEAALKTLQTTLQDGLTAVTGSVEKLEAALKALETVVGANYKALLAEMDKKDGVVDGKITNLANVVAELEADGEAVEAKVVDALAKIAVIGYEEVDGKIVISFADGSSVELSKPLTNVDNNNLVTIVEENGVKYWQVVGAETHTGVVVAHPDQKIDFMVSKENGELYYRVNEGEWVPTGVKAEASDVTAVILTDFEDAETYIKLTVGGVEVVLPKAADFTGAAISRSEAYFVYGVTKTATVEVAEGQEAYVMNKPEGWRATLVDGVLTVTAPAEELINSGAADAEGQVLVHVNAATGSCTVLKMNVTAGPGLVIGYANGEISYFNAMAGLQTNFWGESWYDFTDVWFGLLTIDEFIQYGSMEAYMATQPEPIGGFQTTFMNKYQTGYEEGVYEVFEGTMTLEELVNDSWCGYELVEGETYVLWVVPNTSEGFMYDEVEYLMTDTYLVLDASEPTYANVAFDAAFYGADGYVVGATSKTAFDDWGISEEYTYEMALEEYLLGSYMPGPLMNFNDGDRSAMGKVYESGSYVVNLKDVLLPDYGQVPPVDPNTEYFVWLLPYTASKTVYTMEDLILTTVKTKDLVFNEELLSTVTILEVTAESAKVKILPPAGGVTAFELMTADDFAEYMNGGVLDVEALRAYLLNNYATGEEYTEEYGSWTIEAGETYYFATYTTCGGEYSVGYTTFTTPVPIETPAGKQWIIDPTTNPAWAEMEPYRAVVDLGVFQEGMYFFAVSQEDAYPDIEEAKGVWMAYNQMGISEITATDETSGVIALAQYDDWFEEWTYVNIPYSNYTGTTCTIDFSNVFDFVAECVLADEDIQISSGIAM